MRGIRRCACRPSLTNAVGRPPDSAVVADKNPQRVGQAPRQGVLIFAHTRAHAGGGVGGIAPHASLRQTASPKILIPYQQQRILPQRHRNQRQGIVAILNGGRPLGTVVGLQVRTAPLLAEGDCLIAAGAPTHPALILPDALILVVRINRPRKGVTRQWIYCQGPAKNRAVDRAGNTRIRRAGLDTQRSSRLCSHPRPGHAIRRLVIAVEAHCRQKHAPHRVPHHRRGSIAIRHRKTRIGPLYVHPTTVCNPRQVPGHSTIGRVIQPFIASVGPHRIHQHAAIRLRNRSHHQLQVRRAPCKSGKTFPRKSPLFVLRPLNQIPGVSAVLRTQNTSPVIRVERIVGVARPSKDHPRPARLHSQSPNADGRVQCGIQSPHIVGQRSKDNIRRIGNTCVLRHPHAAAGRSQVEAIARRIGRVHGQRGNAPRHQPEVGRHHRRRSDSLPRCR